MEAKHCATKGDNKGPDPDVAELRHNKSFREASSQPGIGESGTPAFVSRAGVVTWYHKAPLRASRTVDCPNLAEPFQERNSRGGRWSFEIESRFSPFFRC